MITIRSASHHFHRLDDDGVLPSLDARLAAVCRERFRRVDRFVELALLGAGECAQGRPLSPECGLYLSSGIGAMSSNLAVKDAILRGRMLPMPFNFVNTLGSSACFHVARNLGLTGNAVFVSRAGASFAAALECAAVDLELRVIPQALVGAVEECLPDAARQRRLLRRGADAPVAEGSHWLLLEPCEGDPPGVRIANARLEDPTFDGYESRDAARLVAFVQRHGLCRIGLQSSTDGSVILVEQS